MVLTDPLSTVFDDLKLVKFLPWGVVDEQALHKEEQGIEVEKVEQVEMGKLEGRRSLVLTDSSGFHLERLSLQLVFACSKMFQQIFT